MQQIKSISESQVAIWAKWCRPCQVLHNVCHAERKNKKQNVIQVPISNTITQKVNQVLSQIKNTSAIIVFIVSICLSEKKVSYH